MIGGAMDTDQKGNVMEMGIAFEKYEWIHLMFKVDMGNPFPAILEARKFFLKKYEREAKESESILFYKLKHNLIEDVFWCFIFDWWDEKTDRCSYFLLSEENLKNRKEYLFNELYNAQARMLARRDALDRQQAESQIPERMFSLIRGGKKE